MSLLKWRSADFPQDEIKDLFHRCEERVATGGQYLDKEVSEIDFSPQAYKVRVRIQWSPCVLIIKAHL